MSIRVRAIVCLENKLLLVQHKDATGQPYGSWVLPGGKVDNGEFITDAIIREMIEETGVAPQIGKLLYVHQFGRNGQAEGPEFFFEVTNARDYIDINLAATTHGHLEIAEIGFYDPSTLDEVLPEFLKELTEQSLPTTTELVIRTKGGDY